ncbi:MAG: dTDP-4-dehydrorhamnose 3,5-epimerase [Thermoplasmata archaeon]
MKIKELRFKGVYVIELEPKVDKRGFFMRVYDDKIMAEHGLHRNWVQENHSLSVEKGVIRGMHFQFPPHTETKLIRVVAGEIFDVFIDLRKGSPTFGQWDSVILSAENKKMLYLPKGFAHGFCTLTRNCEVVYKVDEYYAPQSEGIVRWNDPDLKINWPTENPILSDKDANAKTFREFVAEHRYLEV